MTSQSVDTMVNAQVRSDDGFRPVPQSLNTRTCCWEPVWKLYIITNSHLHFLKI